MKFIRNITYLLLIVLAYSSCEKQEVEPIGFTKAEYVTNPEKDQVFNYYHDDGKYVGYGLEQYLGAIKSKKNTFTKEQLLIMTFRKDDDFLPDTITPFTYFLGTNYKQVLNNKVEYRISLDYPYDNSAHKNQQEFQFFKDNIDKLNLFKMQIEDNGEFYYDPNVILTEVEYTIDEEKNDIVFFTDDIKASYGFCLKETTWIDSVNISISDGSMSNDIIIIEKGLGKRGDNTNEGSQFLSNVLQMQYTIDEQYYFSQTNNGGWQINDLFIDISNPIQGVIEPSQVSFNLLINDNYIKTHLNITDNTNIEIIEWPEFREQGKLKITGEMIIEAQNKLVNINAEISFKRQR